MTVGKLIELLNQAVDEGVLNPKGEILAAKLNGAYDVHEESLMETIEENGDPYGFYMLASIPEDTNHVVFYTIDKEEEENK